MSIRIITDSASDLQSNEDKKLTVIPLTIRFGEEEYLDGVTLDAMSFYEKLIESPILPKTSQPSPALFTEAYALAKAKGENVIVITLSSKLSGTFQAASIAAQDYADLVTVIDSENVAMGENILVRLAIRLRDSGKSSKEIRNELEIAKKRISLVALLDTLEYLKKGGRISSTAAALGSVLSIKSVIGIRDGEVVVLGKARGSKNGNNMLREKILTDGGVDSQLPLCVGYTGLSDKLLEKYIQDNHDLWEENCAILDTCHVGPSIGTHIGPGAIAVAYFKKRK